MHKDKDFQFYPFFSQLFPFLILLPNNYDPQHFCPQNIKSLTEIHETWWICRP